MYSLTVDNSMKSSKNKCREGPDLVPVMPIRLANTSGNVHKAHLCIAVHSSHDRLEYDKCVCRDFDVTTQYNSLCHNHRVGDTVTHGGHKILGTIVNKNDNITTTNQGAHSENNHRPSKAITTPCFNYRKSDRPSHRKFHISNNNSSCHGNHIVNELDKTCVVVSDNTPPQILPSPRPHSRNVTNPQAIVSDLQTHTHEHAVHNVDSDFTRDIVLALRAVGDNLDARMRFHSEMSGQAVFQPTKMVGGRWLVLTALRKYYTVGVIASVSLELFQQFNRL